MLQDFTGTARKCFTDSYDICVSHLIANARLWHRKGIHLVYASHLIVMNCDIIWIIYTWYIESCDTCTFIWVYCHDFALPRWTIRKKVHFECLHFTCCWSVINIIEVALHTHYVTFVQPLWPENVVPTTAKTNSVVTGRQVKYLSTGMFECILALSIFMLLEFCQYSLNLLKCCLIYIFFCGWKLFL